MYNNASSSQGTSTYSKTGSLQQSQNFIWNTADVLGRGATAVVYFGRDKERGEPCAVKVFSDRGMRHQLTTRQREIDSLRALQHENIVKLIAFEKEKIAGNDVLVMEYCSGGSLYSILEQPQNAFGFPEDEFLVFLDHVGSGVNFLRSRGYVHRDIKPGNIMKMVAEDGRSLYKLTDFGAARELQDDETFMSIYGTEEYLFPRMYEKAVLRQPGTQMFDASVDIWSLAVTIYHVATGQLPFQPFGGRKNTTTMHTLTTKKPSGAISGIQRTPNGDIEWDDKLPASCRLSEYLQAVLVTLLAGCLETNPAKMLMFDQLYQTTTDLLSKTTFNIFCCCSARFIKLYVDKTDTLCTVQEKIAHVTELSAANQLLLWKDRDLSVEVDPTAHVHTYPVVIRNSTLYLVSKQCMDSISLRTPSLPSFPPIAGNENLEGDALIAKKATAVAHLILDQVGLLLRRQKSLFKGEIMYRRYIRRVVMQYELLIPEIRWTLQETKARLMSLQTSYTHVTVVLKCAMDMMEASGILTDTSGQIWSTINQLDDFLKDDCLTKFFEKLSTRMGEIGLYVDVLSKKVREQEDARLVAKPGCREEEHCLSKAENMLQKISAIYTTMSKHRRYGDLHPHEQFIHKCEKQKLQEMCVSMLSLAQDHCNKNLNRCFDVGSKEIGNLLKHFNRTEKVGQNITSVKEGQQQLSKKMEETDTKCNAIVEKILSLIRVPNPQVGGSHRANIAKSGVAWPGVPSPVASSVNAHMASRTGDGQEDAPGMVVESNARQNVRVVEKSEKDTDEQEGVSKPKKQRTMLLDQLTRELLSLQEDSEELKRLVYENSEFMKKFLSETSNLHIDGSLDSDQRHVTSDDT